MSEELVDLHLAAIEIANLRSDLGRREEFIEALSKENQELYDKLKAREWQDISLAPKKATDHPMGAHILLTEAVTGKSFTGRWYEKTPMSNGENYSGFAGDHGLPLTPTHWMPLPPKPIKED